MEEKDKLMTCCICGKLFYGYGNNPEPIRKVGRCCDECNQSLVIPARLAEVINKNKDK